MASLPIVRDCESKSVSDSLIASYRSSCNQGDFEDYFNKLRLEKNRGCQVEATAKLRTLMDNEVKCGIENNTMPASHYYDNYYGKNNDIVDHRNGILSSIYGTNVLFQKAMTPDLYERCTQIYPQRYEDKCSIVALHNIGITCRDDSASLRGTRENLNRDEIIDVVRNYHINIFKRDNVYLASFERRDEIVSYLQRNLANGNITLMLIDYYNVDFDPALPVGSLNGGRYNYPYHTHCCIVHHSINNTLDVYEPFKTFAFEFDNYLNNFVLTYNTPLERRQKLFNDAYFRMLRNGNDRNTSINLANIEAAAIPAASIQLNLSNTANTRNITGSVIRRFYLFNIEQNIIRDVQSRIANSPKRNQTKRKSPVKRKLSVKRKSPVKRK